MAITKKALKIFVFSLVFSLISAISLSSISFAASNPPKLPPLNELCVKIQNRQTGKFIGSEGRNAGLFAVVQYDLAWAHEYVLKLQPDGRYRLRDVSALDGTYLNYNMFGDVSLGYSYSESRGYTINITNYNWCTFKSQYGYLYPKDKIMAVYPVDKLIKNCLRANGTRVDRSSTWYLYVRGIHY